MKKLLLTLLALVLIGSTALADFTNLRDVQNYIMNTAPRDISEYDKATVKGEILSIEFVTGNHYNLILEVDDPNAISPMGYNKPIVVGHFRLHLDSVEDLPFKVGDTALITGGINIAYSTYIVPMIMIEEINGFDREEF